MAGQWQDPRQQGRAGGQWRPDVQMHVQDQFPQQGQQGNYQQQWQPQYPPPPHSPYPVQVNVTQNAYGPRGAVTVTGMSQGWKIFHALMIVCTAGFWLPVYWIHNASAKRRSVTVFR